MLKKRPLRKVVTAKNHSKTLKKRHQVAEKLVAMLDSEEIDIDNVFFSDETWVDMGVAGRANTQNDRKYFDRKVRKSDAVGELEQGKAQRNPGIMVHLTVSSYGGGDVLEPYFYAPGDRVTAEKYVSLPEGTVFRQIEAVCF